MESESTESRSKFSLIKKYLHCFFPLKGLISDFNEFCDLYGSVENGISEKIYSGQTVKREVRIKHDEWSHTDLIIDTYTILNSRYGEISEFQIVTEEFRNNLEIFDREGRKLRFMSKSLSKPCKNRKQNNKENTRKEPYVLRIFPHNPLSTDHYELITLKYTNVRWLPSKKRRKKADGLNGASVNKNSWHRFLHFIGDIVPFYVNRDDLFWYFDLEQTFAKSGIKPDREKYKEGGFNFSLDLTAGTEVNYKIISRIKSRNKGFMGDCINDSDSNFYSEGETVFFALSLDSVLEKILEQPSLFVYIKTKPQMVDNITLSSIQTVSYVIFVATALTVHSARFITSLPLITAVFVALLTLALFPRKSRLLDMRPSVFSLSIGLSTVVTLYFLSTYYNRKVISLVYPVVNKLLPVTYLACVLIFLIILGDVTAFFIHYRMKRNLDCKKCKYKQKSV